MAKPEEAALSRSSVMLSNITEQEPDHWSVDSRTGFESYGISLDHNIHWAGLVCEQKYLYAMYVISLRTHALLAH